MSYITMPDPHPGRCKNYRWQSFDMETRRCLDYEGHDSRCQFPEPIVRLNRAFASTTFTCEPKTPEPWVSPLGVGHVGDENGAKSDV